MDYKEQIDRLRSEISELENSELAVELFDGLITDLLARAEAAEARVKNLSEALERERRRAEKSERERDAAISDLTYIARTYPVDLCDDLVCQYCKHYQNVNTGCPGWTENDCFEWRGKKEE